MNNKFLIRHYEPTLLVIDVQEKLMPHMFNGNDIVDNLSKLIRGFALLGLPTLVTEQYPKGMGNTIEEIAGLLPDVEALEKNTFSIMDDAECAKRVASLPENAYLLITGVETHVCVLQSTLALLEQGRRCGLLVDCVGSRSECNYCTALHRMEQAGADMLTTEMALFDLVKSSTHTAFKDILQLIK